MASLGRPKVYVKALRTEFIEFLRQVTRADLLADRLQRELAGSSLSQGSIEISVFLTRHFAWGWAVEQKRTGLSRSGWDSGEGGGQFHAQEDFVPLVRANHVFAANIVPPKHLDLSPLFDRLLEDLLQAFENREFF